jgi:hypothetical protein
MPNHYARMKNVAKEEDLIKHKNNQRYGFDENFLKNQSMIRYDRLSLVVEKINEIDLTEKNALFTTQFKRNRQNCGKMGYKATICKARREQQQSVLTQVISNYCKKPKHYKDDCFKLLRKNQNLGTSNQRNGMASDTTDVVLSDINSHECFKNIWIDDSGASCHY